MAHTQDDAVASSPWSVPQRIVLLCYHRQRLRATLSVGGAALVGPRRNPGSPKNGFYHYSWEPRATILPPGTAMNTNLDPATTDLYEPSPAPAPPPPPPPVIPTHLSTPLFPTTPPPCEQTPPAPLPHGQYRYTLLSMAACEAALQLPLVGGRYGEDVLFIANDWHASLVPVYVSAKYRPHNVFKNARTVLAIHNLSHQGVDPAVTFPYLGLPDNWYGSVEWVFPEWARAHALDKGEAVNLMKGAIVTADRILTVSKGYAWEICTIEGGWGLDGLLRGRSYKLSGITNGIDVDEWNPSTDKHTPAHFSVGDMAGKAICKRELQKELGLPQRPDVPLLCFIGRLDYQKGPDLLQQIMPELLKADVQFVMLGSGDKDIEKFMAWAEGEYRDKFRGWVGFSVPMAHRITAGSDILLMPSRFEPCGLNQLYAMRYGTVPVAHATGGLRDTIEDFNPFANGKTGSGTGWTYSPNTAKALLDTAWTALGTYWHHKESWSAMMTRGMQQDMSWEKAAIEYETTFEWAFSDPPYA
eukprot:jgi/Mesvir1/12935/Mv05952-RA.4